ncbi:Vitamin B12 transporter BtuB [Thalassocella blandensis]|nr:Vitamin B12 transporter BtuB [Thalassocella blandensis]
MKKNKFNTLHAMASTMALLSGSLSVYADTEVGEARPEVEETVVTGFRASLLKSAEIKREATSIVEAISSEDIGKLPDKSIAEALMRLPGLATQRLNGRAQVISIRGMSPDFGTTLLNGRQQVSTSDNRSVEYDQYPAEFTSTALVYKTPDADVIGQGISGTVDIRTARPLDYNERKIVISARYEQNADEALNSDGSNKGDKETFSYIDQFLDDTLGVAIGLSHTNSPIQGEKFNAWGYAETQDENDNTVLVVGGVKPFVQTDELIRDSVIATVQWQPNETFETAFDVFYSDFSEDQLLRGIELPLGWSSTVELEPGFTVKNGVVTDGVFSNVEGVIRSDATLTDAELLAGGWNSKFHLSDNLSIETDLSYSKAERRTQVIENYSGYIDGPDTLEFHTRGTGTTFRSSLDYTNASSIRITNLQSWGGTFVPTEEGGQKGYYSQPSADDELASFRMMVDYEVEFSVFNAMELGFNYDDRSKAVTTQPEYYFALPNQATQAPLPDNTATTDLSFLGMGSIISYDPLLPMRNGTYELVRAIRADLADKTWDVEEDVLTLMGRFLIDTNMGDTPVTGNIGFQYVMTDQHSFATSSTGEADSFDAYEVSDGDKYNEFLPSLNLKFEISDLDSIRVGLARSLSRPRMDQMRASASYTFNDQLNESWTEDSALGESPWSSEGGNPRLRPWIADNFDLAYEHYFEDELGYFSAAIFYKELDTYIYNHDIVKDYSDYPQPDVEPATMLGTETRPENGSGGYIQGVELSLTVAGEKLTNLLTGFGAVLNYSYNDSSIEPPDTPENTLPGLSKNVYGIQVYYEDYGWSARISQNYRSEFLGPLTSNVGGLEQRIIAETTLVDAQLGYTFESGPLEDLSITLQAYNLNDEPFVTTEAGDENRVIDYALYGRSYALDFNYKF